MKRARWVLRVPRGSINNRQPRKTQKTRKTVAVHQSSFRAFAISHFRDTRNAADWQSAPRRSVAFLLPRCVEFPMNALAEEISPYLLQHADNPVDWYPWGRRRCERAAAEQKPIFLSIGYSACHWCHVMAHESFEDAAIARLLNEHFVCIKVDREERPDLDQLYMEAVQMMTGRGGWPLSVFLTPELQPFFGGTYWPPRRAAGCPASTRCSRAVADAWQNRRDEVLEQAEKLDAIAPRCPLGERSAGRQVGRGTAAELPAGGAEAVTGARSFDPQLRRFRPGAQVSPCPGPAAALAALAAHGPTSALLEMVDDHAGPHGRGRDLRPPRRRLPPLQHRRPTGSCRTSRRCSTTTPCWPAATWKPGRPPRDERIPPRRPRDAGLRAPRHDRSRRAGSTAPKTPTAKARKASSISGRPPKSQAVLGPERRRAFGHVYDVSEPGNFEGRNILHLSKPLADRQDARPRSPAELEAELAEPTARLLAARGAPRPARPRRQGAGELERADDRRPGPGRRRAGRAAVSRGRRAPPPTSCLPQLRDDRGPLAALLAGGPGPAATAFSTIMPACATPW